MRLLKFVIFTGMRLLLWISGGLKCCRAWCLYHALNDDITQGFLRCIILSCNFRDAWKINTNLIRLTDILEMFGWTEEKKNDLPCPSYCVLCTDTLATKPRSSGVIANSVNDEPINSCNDINAFFGIRILRRRRLRRKRFTFLDTWRGKRRLREPFNDWLASVSPSKLSEISEISAFGTSSSGIDAGTPWTGASLIFTWILFCSLESRQNKMKIPSKLSYIKR